MVLSGFCITLYDFQFYFVPQIEASVSTHQFGSPHEHALEGQIIVSQEPVAGTTDIILPVPVTRGRESSSSESSLSEPEEEHSENVPTSNRRDSFYESDEDLSFTTPVKNEPKKKVMKRPVPVPRKQDSVASATSYENEEAIANFKAQETLEKKLREEQLEIAMAAVAKQQELELEQKKNTFELEKTTNEPLQMEMSFNDYENAPMSITAVKSSFSESSPRQPSPELYDYENTSMGPLPTYEEAVSGDLGVQGQGPHGDAEFFDLDDLEAPPVPVRQDSREELVGSPTEEHVTNNTLSDVSSEEVCIAGGVK